MEFYRWDEDMRLQQWPPAGPNQNQWPPFLGSEPQPWPQQAGNQEQWPPMPPGQDVWPPIPPGQEQWPPMWPPWQGNVPPGQGYDPFIPYPGGEELPWQDPLTGQWHFPGEDQPQSPGPYELSHQNPKQHVKKKPGKTGKPEQVQNTENTQLTNGPPGEISIEKADQISSKQAE